MSLVTTARARLRTLGVDPWVVTVACALGLVALFAWVSVNARHGGSVHGGTSASVVGGLGVLLVVSVLRVLPGRGPHETAEPLRVLYAATRAELRRLSSQRRTGATDSSRRAVLEQLEHADRELQHGLDDAGSRRRQELDRLTLGWRAGSDERGQVLAVVALGERLGRNGTRSRRRVTTRDR